MSWNSRKDFWENMFYHVYNRGFMKQTIFWNKDQFQMFYTYLILYLKDYTDIKLVSYALLPNHFHLILRNLKQWKDISDFMKKVQWRYSTRYRIKYPIEYKQPVFEWRFKAKLIDNEQYLYQCIAYVNYNPVKHQFVENIDDYPYTSYHQIVNKDKFKKVPVPDLIELEI